MKTDNKFKTPHDEFFKAVFSRKDIAMDFIREFLPENLVSQLNLAELRLKNTSYVDSRLKEYFSDIVYTCPYGNNEEVIITFLWEHKSAPSRYPHLQLKRYMLEVWEDQLKHKQPLMPIIPALFYHGKKKWIKRAFFDSIKGGNEITKPFIPEFDYILIDINKWEDEDILRLKVGFLLNALMVFKHGTDKNYILQFSSRLFYNIENIQENQSNLNFIQSIFVYLFKTNELSKSDFDRMINQLDEPEKNKVMDGYKPLIKDIYEEGREEGLAIGIIKFFQQGFTKHQIAEIFDISLEKVEAIILESGKKT